MKKKHKHGGRREGAGRPKVLGEWVRFSIAVEVEDVEALDKHSRGKKISRSDAIREAIRLYVTPHKWG